MWFELVVNVGRWDTVNARSRYGIPFLDVSKLLGWCYDMLSVSGDGTSVCSLSSIAS
ncbi:hypothetical protein SAMN05216219_2476 [Mycetocola miduiensis]|uniref:Uncharacterized protein n=1 Tax=Mycetocola miduiensis TaxID=995034 RepID=A0A1I5CQA4_9MICO|nr:hypothetical protein SAMN05216219_2476 [Mycetocola miduiensis]